MAPDGLAHHGVLAHQHHSLAPQGHADLLHLLGAHIVCSHDEAFWVVVQELDDLKEVVGLPGRPVFPGHHDGASGIATWGLKTMFLKGKSAAQAAGLRSAVRGPGGPGPPARPAGLEPPPPPRPRGEPAIPAAHPSRTSPRPSRCLCRPTPAPRAHTHLARGRLAREGPASPHGPFICDQRAQSEAADVPPAYWPAPSSVRQI